MQRRRRSPGSAGVRRLTLADVKSKAGAAVNLLYLIRIGRLTKDDGRRIDENTLHPSSALRYLSFFKAIAAHRGRRGPGSVGLRRSTPQDVKSKDEAPLNLLYLIPIGQRRTDDGRPIDESTLHPPVRLRPLSSCRSKTIVSVSDQLLFSPNSFSALRNEILSRTSCGISIDSSTLIVSRI
jgi:hypothetical protein